MMMFETMKHVPNFKKRCVFKDKFKLAVIKD